MIEERDNRTLVEDAGESQTVAVIVNPEKAAIVNTLKTTVETMYVSSWNEF